MHYVFQDIRFLQNMQCVINIQHCCQNVQWSMHIAAFLETRKITVEGKRCLQVANCLYSLN